MSKPVSTLQHAVDFYERQLKHLREELKHLAGNGAVSLQNEQVALMEVRLKFARERLERAEQR